MKYIQTVCGAVSPNQIGFTLPHEHIFWDLNIYLPKDLDRNDKSDARNQNITLENLSEVRSHFQKYSQNVVQHDLDVAIKELIWYKQAGGSAICDCTVRGINPNPSKIKIASDRSGVHILLGTGYYCHNSLTDSENRLDKDKKAEQILHDLRKGFDDTDIKAGFIKIGVESIDSESDKQSLAAAAIAQKETGAAILIHQPGIEHQADGIFKALTDNGGDLNRVVMCHCDPLLPDHDYIDHIAKCGAYISFDFFGLESRLSPTFWLPTDRDRVFAIMQQIDRGNLNKLLMSHDTVYKTMLRSYGGYGYAHLPHDMVPVFLAHGYTQKWINQMTIENPRKIFSLSTDKFNA